MKNLTYIQGQLTLELVIALGILTIGLSGLILATFGGQSLQVDTQESNRALNYARQNIENSYAQGQADFSGLVYASSTQGEFLVERIVLDIDVHRKRITSRVTWRTNLLRLQKIELDTIVTDWRALRDSGDDTGGDDICGDWTNPSTLGSVDLGAGEEATGLDAFNKYVYMSAIASDSKKDDFFIVNATNPQSPVIIGRVDTGDGLNKVEYADGYAYAANNDNDEQLQIIDVSVLSSPTTTATLTLPGVSGTNAVGNSMFYYNQRIYIGTRSAPGPEFHVVNVSNPQNPSSLGSFEVGADVNAIYISGNTAYLATSDDAQELKILDIGAPASISQIGSFNGAGGGDGKSLRVAGNKLYLGRSAGSGSELYVLDVTNPGSVQQMGVQSIGADVNSVAIRNDLIFLGSSDSNKEFQVWNIKNPASISFWSSFNFPQVASGIDYEDNLVYTSVRSNDALRIITSQAGSCPNP